MTTVARISAILVAAAAVSPSIGTAHASPPTSSVSGTPTAISAISADRLPHDAAAGYRMNYSTTDEYGHPAVSAGQIYVPRGTPPAGGWRVVSWAKGTVGVGNKCSMDYALTHNLPAPPAVEMAEPLVEALLRAGIAVVSTDYVGLTPNGKHHYLNSSAESHAVVDMVSAAHTALPQLSQTWAAAGHSQGGQAAITASALVSGTAATKFRGTVAFAPASNTETALGALGPEVPSIGPIKNLTATLIYVLYGLRDSRPDLHLDSYLTPRGRALVDRAPQLCIFDLRSAVSSLGPNQVLAKPLIGPVADALRTYMSVPVAGQRKPITIEHGTHDTVVPTAGSALLTTQLLANGAQAHLDLVDATHYDVIAKTTPQSVTVLRRLLS
ncbi:lipase family protein [Gordonia sp. 852002-10350_SCH5691597]|uniref:lipase family protein n=1 Tax=Gordonia sp. 852002-10350_SCH5691597 TaxID=1834085 RepID=UPI0007E92F45|nr:lipase family protein [Gordonia sp. 852002-10350_SCH5691597]OBA64675.1 hypothetical protein A5777_21930 [Gordonia sp. 852002-10350_SCH5691597]